MQYNDEAHDAQVAVSEVTATLFTISLVHLCLSCIVLQFCSVDP